MAEGALSLVVAVARALGDLRGRVVFIGGAISPLLQEDPPFPGPRPTDDVDAIAITADYADFNRLQAQLRAKGFRESSDAPHAHRWIAPDERRTKFDLVPIGEHLGASGNPWDEAALASAVEAEIEPGLVIRHASAPGLLALKFAAFRDRGSDDPFASHDLEDILALIASRPEIVDEVASAPREIQSFIVEQVRELISRDELDDLLAAHLGNVARARAAAVIVSTRDRLMALLSL
jgi:predicted nucleotidyltransferase